MSNIEAIAARRIDVQEEARRWVGTPYRHQHRAQGLGADCIGLIWGVGEAASVLHIDLEAARPFLGYTRLPNPKRMGKALELFWVPVEDGIVEPGDFCWIAWPEAPDLPMHLALLTEGPAGPRLIHAWAAAQKVVEHDFTAEWQKRAVSWWRYPGLC